MTGRPDLPRISIVTPSYNQGEFLEECIDSVLGQGYPNLEYVILDGGSTDDSAAIIEKHEKHLSYWRSAKDGGQYAAIDEGFRRCTGEVMAWLNSDDKYHPDALWKVAYLFAHHADVEWITGRHTEWSARGEATCIHTDYRWSRRAFLDQTLGPGTVFIQQESTFWRRRLWLAAGGRLDTSLSLAGDFELWCRFFRRARLYSVATWLGGYRVHAGQKVGRDTSAYIDEAARILERERALAGKESPDFFPDPPPLLHAGDIVTRALRTAERGTACGGFAGGAGAEQPDGARSREPAGLAMPAVPGAARTDAGVQHRPAPGGRRLPGISIVVVSYDERESLEECIDSILAQGYPELELVVVDAGSTDGSMAVIERYEKRLSGWCARPGGKRYAALADGFARATGEIMAWLDASAKYGAGALWTVAQLFREYPEVDWIAACRGEWDDQGRFVALSDKGPSWTRESFLAQRLDGQAAPIPPESTFWRRELWERAGSRIDDAWELAADFELWCRFFRYGPLHALNAPLGGRHSSKLPERSWQLGYWREAEQILARERAATQVETRRVAAPAPLLLNEAAVMDLQRRRDDAHVEREAAARYGMDRVASPAAAEASEQPIIVATSIAPGSPERQRAAVQSWLDLGFQVLSVNIAEEIAKLAEMFPEVTFVTARRDGRALAGRPLVYFDDLLAALRASGASTCGIVNSDICLAYERSIAAQLRCETRGSLIYGSRVDVESLARPVGSFYSTGYDFFFFDRALIDRYPASGFLIGMPWWDYWVPMAIHLRGIEIKRLDSPFAYHVIHARNYSDELFVRFGRLFTEQVLKLRLGDLERDFRSIRFDLGYAVNVCQLVPESVAALSRASSRLRNVGLERQARLARGEMLYAEGERHRAEAYFRRALQDDSRSLRALNNLAVTAWDSGDAVRALELLSRALELAPHDSHTLRNAGSILEQIGGIEGAQARDRGLPAAQANDAEKAGRLEA